MPREDHQAKGLRYLSSGRLVVNRVSNGEIEAQCRGDSGEIYRVGYSPGAWYCDCPALSRCAHLAALQLVVVRPRRET